MSIRFKIHFSSHVVTGDLKLVEKPQPVVLAPQDFCNIKANVKVSSTGAGFV